METQLCPQKALSMSGGPCSECIDWTAGDQALVLSPSLMGIMNPWKPLEATQVWQGLVRGRFRVHWGAQEKARPHNVDEGVPGPIHDPHGASLA